MASHEKFINFIIHKNMENKTHVNAGEGSVIRLLQLCRGVSHPPPQQAKEYLDKPLNHMIVIVESWSSGECVRSIHLLPLLQSPLQPVCGCTYLCMCVYMCACMYTLYAYLYIYIYIYMYIYVFLYVYMYVGECIYICMVD